MEQEQSVFTEEKFPKKLNKGFLGIGLVLIVLGFVGAGVALFPFVFPLKQTETVFVYELGTPVSRNVADYVFGNSQAMAKAVVDLSLVDMDKVGTYPAWVKQGLYRYEAMICIEDHTPPKLICQEGPFVLKKGENYDLEFFGIRATDLCGQVSVGVSFEGAREQKDYHDSISYNNTGYYGVQVQATDASGNVTRRELQVLVDEGPQLIGVKDIYQVPGMQLNYLEGVQSLDTIDGDLTALLNVDTGAVDNTKPGLYTIRYLSVDQYGFDTLQEARVHVLEPEVLQHQLNTHQINRLECRIEGAPNLYDSGYFEAEDVPRVLTEMEPAVVGICAREGYWGSGFILEINEQEIILCTNQHVVEDFVKADIIFHEGTRLQGELAGSVYDQDIAFFSVPLNSVPQELLDTLKTVHINFSYWEGLAEDAALTLCMRTIDKDGDVWRDRIGILLDKTTEVPEGIYYRLVAPITEMDLKLFHGCSGSAVWDGYGNLIAMAAAHTDGHYYGIYLTNILEAFRKIFGREVYYE